MIKVIRVIIWVIRVDTSAVEVVIVVEEESHHRNGSKSSHIRS